MLWALPGQAPCQDLEPPAQDALQSQDNAPAALFDDDPDTMESVHRYISDKVLTSAVWIDNYFDDDRSREEENKTTFSLGFKGYTNKSGGPGIDINSDLRLRLPKTEKRWMLLIKGSKENDESHGATPADDLARDHLEQTGEQASVTLQNTLLDTARRNFNLGGGVSFRRTAIVPYGTARYRQFWENRIWDFRFMQRLRYYTDNDLLSTTSFDIERDYKKIFLRGTWEVNLSSRTIDERRPYNIAFHATHTLTHKEALQLSWVNGFETKPRHLLDTVTLELNYRRHLRKYMYLDITPKLVKRHSDNYANDPGISIQLKFEFGHQSEEEKDLLKALDRRLEDKRKRQDRKRRDELSDKIREGMILEQQELEEQAE